MSDLSKNLPHTAKPAAGRHHQARMLQCEVCGQVFDARNIGDLVHHSLMGPGHEPLPH